MATNFFQSKDTIRSRLQQEKTILLFLDYDGTLAPFHKNPLMVETPHEILETLEYLKAQDCIHIIIISGRTIDEIKQRVPLDHVSYAAVHGMHIELSDGTKKIWNPSDLSLKKMRIIKERIQQQCQSIIGFNIEDKTSSIAFHYRNVSSEEKLEVIQKILQIIFEMDPERDLNMIQGDEVIEIRSKTMNKGLAVKYINNHFDHDHLLCIYIGDDTTDEDAFRMIGPNGITLFVQNDSDHASEALYWISSQTEVLEVLRFFKKSLVNRNK